MTFKILSLSSCFSNTRFPFDHLRPYLKMELNILGPTSTDLLKHFEDIICMSQEWVRPVCDMTGGLCPCNADRPHVASPQEDDKTSTGLYGARASTDWGGGLHWWVAPSDGQGHCTGTWATRAAIMEVLAYLTADSGLFIAGGVFFR